jgi:DNA-binding beta-propeller fold protein YncE
MPLSEIPSRIGATRIAVFLMFCTVAPIFGQDTNSDQLRALLKSVPQLPVERIDAKVNPPMMFEGISAVTTDKRGNIYVIHRPADGDPIVVLDPQGNFIRSWGKGMFKIPHGIRIDPAGNVWTVDANTSMVYKFTPEGKKLLEIAVGDVPDKTKEFCGATDIAFAKSGHVFVSDGYCNARVIEYDAAGKKLREWGKHGTAPGEFNLVHSIAIGPRGNLYVADRENGRLQWFDQSGKFLGEWKYGGQFYAVAFSQKGEFYAATHPKGVSLDEEFNVVKIDLASGKILGKFGVRSHELGIAPDGTLLPATRSSQLVLLKPR